MIIVVPVSEPVLNENETSVTVTSVNVILLLITIRPLMQKNLSQNVDVCRIL